MEVPAGKEPAEVEPSGAEPCSVNGDLPVASTRLLQKEGESAALTFPGGFVGVGEVI